MQLNTLRPAMGTKKAAKRVGRGIGSGSGKTGGRGHKGQKSRSGGFRKTGFEGGQMPLQRRLPKRGFSSRIGARTFEVRLHELAKVDTESIDLNALKSAGIIPRIAKRARVMLSGELSKAVVLKGIAVSKGARAAVEAAGGRVEE